MQLAKWIRGFLRKDGGAVAAEWVVMTATITGLGMATIATVTTVIVGPDGPTGTIARGMDSGGSDQGETSRAAEYAYVPFHFTDDEIDSAVRESVASDSDDPSRAQIEAIYHDHVQGFLDAVDRGAARDAAHALDKLHIWDRRMHSMGMAVPDRAPTVRDLDTRYRETLNADARRRTPDQRGTDGSTTR